MAISLTSTSTTSTITANSADILTSDSSGEVSLRTGGSLKEIPVAVKDALNATGTAPIYAARAWVNFDGTTTGPTIRASGNVSSVASIAAGVYEINFTTAMPDANYSVFCASPVASASGSTYSMGVDTGSAAANDAAVKTTTTLRVRGRSSGGVSVNTKENSFSIFR
jgi:hypothetical protein